MQTLLSLFERHRQLVLGVSVASIVLFVASIALLPWLAKRAPQDFFLRQHRPHGLRAWLLWGLRNVFGALLVLLGTLMLVLPGQGLLTLVLGLGLLDFPGKHRLQTALVRRPSVTRALNWLRQRVNEPPFDMP